jgi:hypothetical protein
MASLMIFAPVLFASPVFSSHRNPEYIFATIMLHDRSYEFVFTKVKSSLTTSVLVSQGE